MRTITLSDEAYTRLEESKHNPEESISAVVLRTVASPGTGSEEEDRPWMKLFGCLRDDAEELRRIDRIINEEFEKVDPEDWR